MLAARGITAEVHKARSKRDQTLDIIAAAFSSCVAAPTRAALCFVCLPACVVLVPCAALLLQLCRKSPLHEEFFLGKDSPSMPDMLRIYGIKTLKATPEEKPLRDRLVKMTVLPEEEVRGDCGTVLKASMAAGSACSIANLGQYIH